MAKNITKSLVVALAGLALGFGMSYYLLKPEIAIASESNETERSIPPKKKSNGIDGIDVSHHNPIDKHWKAVASGNDLHFVYIKATEGATHRDSMYKKNSRQARKYGLKVGAYHFFTMTSSPRKQFENFKKATVKKEMDLIPMIDVELYKDKKGWHIGKYYTNNKKQFRAMRDNIKTLVNLFEKEYGCKPMIYCTCCSYNMLIKGNVSDCPIYLGHYAKKPGVKNYTIWQYSDKGTIKGYPHHIDVCKFAKGKSMADILLSHRKK
ncbi:MAG: hypothetical protein KBT04_04090 [Bacteroidales bacterium]|nr:hypothetical protein [Candidatus Colimorpha onthohippi]